MLGADTELDRQVLELIRDPLTHMVRNSGDHGLESPAERRAAGKPETGHVTLNAYHEGGHIIIEVSDDGRGLPVEKIRAKVLANGLATEAELASMPEAQIQRFIFRAGFSTATNVTAVSGRGVGMDVVKTNIEKIGGTVDLEEHQRPGHQIRHQDSADPGHRFGSDRRSGHGTVRHSANQRRRAGTGAACRRQLARRERRERDRTDQRHAGSAPARPPVAPLVSLGDLLGLGLSDASEPAARISS